MQNTIDKYHWKGFSQEFSLFDVKGYRSKAIGLRTTSERLINTYEATLSYNEPQPGVWWKSTTLLQPVAQYTIQNVQRHALSLQKVHSLSGTKKHISFSPFSSGHLINMFRLLFEHLLTLEYQAFQMFTLLCPFLTSYQHISPPRSSGWLWISYGRWLLSSRFSRRVRVSLPSSSVPPVAMPRRPDSRPVVPNDPFCGRCSKRLAEDLSAKCDTKLGNKKCTYCAGQRASHVRISWPLRSGVLEAYFPFKVPTSMTDSARACYVGRCLKSPRCWFRSLKKRVSRCGKRLRTLKSI